MKISEKTIALMNHVAWMNQSFLVDSEVDQNQFRSVNPARSATVFVGIPEQLPPFMVYDLKELLSCISALQAKDGPPDLTFNDNHVVVSNDDSSIRYYFCDESVIRPQTDKWPKQPKAIEAHCSFTLSKSALEKARKISSTMGLGEFVFETEDSNLMFSAVGEKNSGIKNNYRANLGQCEGELKGPFSISSSLMQLFPADYSVTLNENGLAVFESELDKEYSLKYYIAPIRFGARES